MFFCHFVKIVKANNIDNNPLEAHPTYLHLEGIIMTKTLFLSFFVIAFLGVLTPAIAGEQESNASKIDRAMSAAPSSISVNAKIIDTDGSLLREGANGWVCIPGVPLIPGDKHPMCNDAVWMAWLDAAAKNEVFSTDTIGTSYMLAGDALVNNDNPAATDPNDGGMWVQEGPHLMLLLPNKDILKNLPRNPQAGGPYVMWGETPLVHVMVPTGQGHDMSTTKEHAKMD